MKHIEILKNWLEKAVKHFSEKYTKIMAHEGLKNNSEMIEYNDAMVFGSKIKIWGKKLNKMLKGKEMPTNVLKKIEALETEELR